LHVKQLTFLPSQQWRSRTALFERPVRINYSIFYECDTIAWIEERWVGALQLQMNVTAGAF
jgi:hypothetical protein